MRTSQVVSQVFIEFLSEFQWKGMMPATCVPKKRLASKRVRCKCLCFPFCQAALISLFFFEICLDWALSQWNIFSRGSIIFMCGLPGHAGAPYMYGGSFQEREQHQFCCHFPSSYVVVFVVCWLVIIWENFSSDLISLQDPLLRLQVCCERPDGGALHWAKTGKLKHREACICIFVKSSQKMLQLQEVG